MSVLHSNEKASELESLASLDGGKLPESRTANLRGMSYAEQMAALAPPVQMRQAGPGAPAAPQKGADIEAADIEAADIEAADIEGKGPA